MDAPESPPDAPPSPAAVALYEDSPIFNFINTLSPINTLKPDSVRNVQPSDLPSVSSLFTSPHVNHEKKSKLTIRDGFVQLSQEALNPNYRRSQMGTSSCNQLSGSTTIASENSSTNCAADNIHVYCAGASAVVATNNDPKMRPGASQSQLVSNDCFYDTLDLPSDDMPMDNTLSQHQYGMHRRSLFNEKIGTSSMSVQSVSNLHYARTCGDNYLMPAGSPAFALPGIGLHLNAVASNSKEIMPYGNPLLPPEHNCLMKSVVSGNELVPYSSEGDAHIQNDHSSQKTVPNAAESGQEIYKKKRRKFQSGDSDSCRNCSCKKSKCLKLYCACFAARVYCSEFCSCQGCSNNHTEEETVICTRKRIESRDPLAFAPKVTRTCGSSQEFLDDSNKTPASARHKRGCNCRRSFCLKKYCECFQIGVGCSISCRCESCKNSFGKREGVSLLTTEKMEQGDKGQSANVEFDKQHEIGQSGYLPSTENLLATPSIEPCRSSVLLPSTSSKPPLSSTRCSSRLHNPQSRMKEDVLLETCSAEMILGNGPSGIQERNSFCTAGVKVVSPNKKRVSPLRIGTSLSPIGRSSRKLILKSIPSFPSLTGDVTSEPH